MSPKPNLTEEVRPRRGGTPEFLPLLDTSLRNYRERLLCHLPLTRSDPVVPGEQRLHTFLHGLPVNRRPDQPPGRTSGDTDNRVLSHRWSLGRTRRRQDRAIWKDTFSLQDNTRQVLSMVTGVHRGFRTLHRER